MSGVPRISEFYGIVIAMYFDDHPPPHFHARYAGAEAVFVIATGEMLAGSLPPRGSGSCENGWKNTATSSPRTSSVAACCCRWNRSRRCHERIDQDRRC
jgi:hypothetical protein